MDYVFREDQFTEETGTKFAQPVNVKVHTEAELAEKLASSNIGISKPEALAAIAATNEITREWVSQGEAYNGGLVHIHFSVPGKYHDGETPEKVAIRITPSKELVAVADGLSLHKVGASTPIYISDVKDTTSGESNTRITRNQDIIITGNNIKLVGDSPLVGVWFDQVDGGLEPQKGEDLVLNEPSRIIIRVPGSLGDGSMYRIRVTTFFSGSIVPLKEMRSATMDKPLQAS